MSDLPLVLLPGLQSDRRSWTEQLRYFDRRRRIIVPEGHLEQPSIAAMGEVVMAQLPDRFHLVAWSMGGYIALHMIPRLSRRLQSLVLVSTSARSDTPEITERRLRTMELAGQQSMRATATQGFAFSVSDVGRVAPDVREAVIQSSVDIGFETYCSQQLAIIDRKATFTNLPLVEVPTLIIAGAEDPVVAPDGAVELRDGIAGARLVMIPDCGHCPPFERPDTFNTTLDSWLEETELDGG